MANIIRMAGNSGASGVCRTTKVYWQAASLAGMMSIPEAFDEEATARGRGQSGG